MSALMVVLAGAVLFPITACAQTVTFTYNLSCNVNNDPNCPRSNLTVATKAGQVASDLVPIATVNSDVPGYTNPVPIDSGALNWSSTPATRVYCDLQRADGLCSQYGGYYDNPGGSSSITGSVFGLPSGSTLLTASFQGGATSVYYLMSGDEIFSGTLNVSYFNPVVMADLGLAGLPNSGTGTISDNYYPPDESGNETFQVSVTFTTFGSLEIIHNFTGGDGSDPSSGLTMDGAGNLYGAATEGGYTGGNCATNGGCGTVFKLSRKGSGWIFSPLYSFTGGDDGEGPTARVIMGPDGSLYGTTAQGGGCSERSPGCGTVFKLQPPATACKTALCTWRETVLYAFSGASDGNIPSGEIVFDHTGNLYGVTELGGAGHGVVYELTPSNGVWKENVIDIFTGGADGGNPAGGLIIDQAGNLYGTTVAGGAYDLGTVFQLTPSGSSWKENVIYSFPGGGDGQGGEILISDQSGNLYGSTFDGIVFILTPSGGSWASTVIYSGGNISLIDKAGNLYGAGRGGPYESLFKLVPSNGNWTYDLLFDFAGGVYGQYQSDYLVLDGNGNLYGTAGGGTNGDGVVFELPPQ